MTTRIPGTLVHRADLLLALAGCSPADRKRVAAHCGFGDAELGELEPPPLLAAMPCRPLSTPTPHRREPATVPAELTFLRVDSYEPIEGVEEELSTQPDELGDEPIHPAQLDAEPYTIRPQPLQPWPRLWPFLHHVLGHFVAGSRVDMRRLVDDVARHRPVLKVPYQPQLAWAPQVHILIDDGPAMSTFREDVAWLLEQLQRMRGREGLFVTSLSSWADRRGSLRGPTPHAGSLGAFDRGAINDDLTRGETLLVISDLGCLDNSAGRIGDWLDFGRRLQRRGVHRFALSPCPRDRWDPRLARVWNWAPWDRDDRPPRGRGGRQPLSARDETQQQRRLAALLAACSLMLRVEAPLLRELSLLLPGADAALEHDLRSDPAVVSVPGVCAVGPDDVQRLREEFAAAGRVCRNTDDEFVETLKQELPGLLARHHAGHSAALWASERQNMHDAGLDVSAAESQAIGRAIVRAVYEQLPGAGSQAASVRHEDELGLHSWIERELARATDAQAVANKELAAAAAYKDRARQLQGLDVHPPTNVDRTVYHAHYDYAASSERRRQTWRLCRRGDNFELAAPDEPRSAGTPLGTVPMFSPRLGLDWLQMEEDQEQRRSLCLLPGQTGRGLEAGAARKFRAESDRCRFGLEAVPVPPWATRFGWDRFGLFADFAIDRAGGSATFTLRWIPPGEFTMGSPEDEPGRWDAEGPQHRVVIPEGFWMGATPVTQEQYTAVTGRQPSYFVHAGEDAPVEQVSWHDCRAACDELPQLDAGWQFRLPSEAEWEYACRAGTASTLYTGSLTIEGANNGPELHEIAWYGGNSGVEYAGGFDSSSWGEKQFPHDRSGTHPVGRKQPNGWGLFDMLGNVWEWCEDEWHGGYEGAPDDGTAWVAGGGRVCRGGSWADDARGCRCAFRDYWRPDSRNFGVGFRLVLSRSSARHSVRPG